MTNRLQGKIAVVVGAGSVGPGWGNGKATAVTYAREGATVWCADRSLEAADVTTAFIRQEGGTAFSVAADVTRSDDLRRMVAHAVEAHGRIDILHNNVGIEDVADLEEVTEESWDHVHAVNLKSVMLACKYAIPHMKRQGAGAIVNVSSAASIRWGGVPFLSYYSSKAALNHFTKMVARQYAPLGIRCNVILPGLIDTPHVRVPMRGTEEERQAQVAKRNRKCPMGFMGEPWDVANAALFLASDEARYVTGVELLVDGGITL